MIRSIVPVDRNDGCDLWHSYGNSNADEYTYVDGNSDSHCDGGMYSFNPL